MSPPPAAAGDPEEIKPVDADALDRGASLADTSGIASPSPAGPHAVELNMWKLALPAVGTNLLHSSVGVVSVTAVGTLGPEALAAVTGGERIFFVLQVVLMAVTAGTTALVARAYGRGDYEEVALVTRASLFLCLAVAVVASAIGILGADLFTSIFQLEASTLALSATYLRWIMLFNAAFAVFIALSSSLRASGDTMTPLFIGALANVLNMALLFPLVFGSFGFDPLGVVGAALSGGISFTVGSLVLLFLWLTKRLRIGVGGPGAFSKKRVRQLIRIGTPAGLEQLCFQAGFIVFLWLISFYGEAPYAAYSIGVRILSFSFVVGIGFSIAASTMVGQHLGAGDPVAATQAGWRATRISVGVMLVFGAAIILFATPMARMMVSDEETVRHTVHFIYILGSMQPLMAVEFALSGSLRGAGDTRFPFYVVLIGMLGMRATSGALAVYLELPVVWVFMALVPDYVVKGILLIWRFRSGRWQHAIAG
jgi:putative MATE family efflux protein